MATPYMAMTLPTPGVTNDLIGEQQEVAAFNVIDGHDHTSGKGVQVPISGLNINADLPLTTAGTAYNITGVKALRLSKLSATPTAATDINEIVDSGGDLYWMNNSGQAVQITAGAALSATSLGGISGLPSGTASAAFGSQTFTWRSATNTAATMDAGPVLIRDTALGALAITLQSPVSLASAYSLTLPTALPASSKLLSISSGGAASYADVDNSTLQNSAGTISVKSAGITRTQLASVGQQVSSSCGTFTSSSGVLVDVTNLSVTLTTAGRPVILAMISDGGVSAAGVTNNNIAGVAVALDRGGATIALWSCNNANTTAALANLPGATFFGSGGFVHIDPVGAGTYTYKVRINPGGSSLSISNYKLAAYEL